jgi:hypothetical protein
MYKSFKIIDDFVKEVYGINLIEKSMDPKIANIKELKEAYNVIMEINNSQKKPFSKQFIKFVYPLLEVAVQWSVLKNENKSTRKFVEKCKKRVKNQSNFYGTIFEIDMASRCLLSDWQINFIEDYAEQRKQIDFIFFKSDKQDTVLGIECSSSRYTQENLTVEKINKKIKKKAQKFKKEYIEKLDFSLDKKLLIIDITTNNYVFPSILENIDKIRRNDKLDAVIFTWREDIVDGENHSLITKYKTIGNNDDKYFSVTYAAEFHKGPVFFIRKHIEPEPKVICVGKEIANKI